MDCDDLKQESRKMKKSLWSFVGRVAILFVLYPWLVSYDSPGDSLSHQISLYGSEGTYTYVTRDCAGNITSQLPVPFSEIAASYEGPIQNAWGYKVRAGYLSSAHGYNLVPGINVDSTAASPFRVAYGGGSFTFNRPFWGFELGGLAFNQTVTFASSANLVPTLGLRLGYLSAWYFTMGLLNSDPLIGSRPMFNTGIGFSLGRGDRMEATRTEPGHLWFGVGLGPPFETSPSFLSGGPSSLDGMLSGELSVPAFDAWHIALRGGYDPNGHGGGYASGGLSYGW